MTDFVKQLIEGYLWQNGSFKDQKPGSWEKSWYVIQENSLSSYKKKDAKHLKSGIDLADAIAVKSAPQFSTKKRFVFSLSTKLKTHYFYTTADSLRANWLSALENKILKQKEPQRPAPSAPPISATPTTSTSQTMTSTTTTSSNIPTERQIQPDLNNQGAVSSESALPEGAAVLFQVIALFDCEAEEEGDLTFNAGDVIDILAMDEGWWTGAVRGMIGILPSNYVEVIEPSTLQRLMGVQSEEAAVAPNGEVPPTQDVTNGTPAVATKEGEPISPAVEPIPIKEDEKDIQPKENETIEKDKEINESPGRELQEAEPSPVSNPENLVVFPEPSKTVLPSFTPNIDLHPNIQLEDTQPMNVDQHDEQKELDSQQQQQQQQQHEDKDDTINPPNVLLPGAASPVHTVTLPSPSDAPVPPSPTIPQDDGKSEPEAEPVVIAEQEADHQPIEIEKEKEIDTQENVVETQTPPLSPVQKQPTEYEEDNRLPDNKEEEKIEEVQLQSEQQEKKDLIRVPLPQEPEPEPEQEQSQVIISHTDSNKPLSPLALEEEKDQEDIEPKVQQQDEPVGESGSGVHVEKSHSIEEEPEDDPSQEEENNSDTKPHSERSTDLPQDSSVVEPEAVDSPTTPLPTSTIPSTPRQQKPQEKFVEVPVLFHVEVLFDFAAENETELTVNKGTILSVLEKDQGGGWFKCQSDSRCGFVPGSYVRNISPEDFQARKVADNKPSPIALSREEELNQVSQRTSSLRDKWKSFEQQQTQQQQQPIIKGNAAAARTRMKELLEKAAAGNQSTSNTDVSVLGTGAARPANNLRAQWESRIREAQLASATPSKPARRLNNDTTTTTTTTSNTTTTTTTESSSGAGPTKLSSDKKALVAGLFSKAPPPVAVASKEASASQPAQTVPKTTVKKPIYGALPPPGPPPPTTSSAPPSEPTPEIDSLEAAEQELLAAQQKVAQLRQQRGIPEPSTTSPPLTSSASSPNQTYVTTPDKKNKKKEKEKDKDKDKDENQKKKEKKLFYRLSRRF